jgi:hypothetical protein
MSDDDTALAVSEAEAFVTLDLDGDDMAHLREAFAPMFTRDLRTSVTIAVHLFALAICRWPPDVRIRIVSDMVEPILKISAELAKQHDETEH